MKRKLLCTALIWTVAIPAHADPCGMVPPIDSADMQAPIERVGPQKTYVFHRNGIETLVLRPAFSGKIHEFGMLIPFPSPPAIRKVPDEIFKQIAAAIDPPEIPLYVRPGSPRSVAWALGRRGGAVPNLPSEDLFVSDEVRVLKREAVGMYEVAVLEAGSARALARWMADHAFRYPDGMDDVTDEYVEAGWCFVAVKARVADKRALAARPGMRKVDSRLPVGSKFEGAVQAMGFRFHTEQPVVPMRLSVFNPGELRNVVYVLSDRPVKIRQLPETMVVRQVAGRILQRNLSGLLPVRVIDGTVADVTENHMASLKYQRDPGPTFTAARELFASDIRAAMDGRLVHRHETSEKVLLSINEALHMRDETSTLMASAAVEEERRSIYEDTFRRLADMTMTVIDGDFPRDLLAKDNLQVSEFRMEAKKNSADAYHAPTLRGRGQRAGELFFGTPKHLAQHRTGWRAY